MKMRGDDRLEEGTEELENERDCLVAAAVDVCVLFASPFLDWAGFGC